MHKKIIKNSNHSCS